jgi:predicted RNase H-like nuclease (RuvC/YqgF family)
MRNYFATPALTWASREKAQKEEEMINPLELAQERIVALEAVVEEKDEAIRRLGEYVNEMTKDGIRYTQKIANLTAENQELHDVCQSEMRGVFDAGMAKIDEYERALKARSEHIFTLEAENERLRTMSTVEMMCENYSVKCHIEEWEKRCLKAEAENERLTRILEKLLDWSRKYPQTEPYVTELDHVIKLAQNAVIEEQQEFENAIWKEPGYKPVWRKDEKNEPT